MSWTFALVVGSDGSCSPGQSRQRGANVLDIRAGAGVQRHVRPGRARDQSRKWGANVLDIRAPLTPSCHH